jgi:hypothetical protein
MHKIKKPAVSRRAVFRIELSAVSGESRPAAHRTHDGDDAREGIAPDGQSA